MSTAIDLDTGGIGALQAISRLPREPEWATPEVLTHLVREEAAIRDDLVAYGYAYGAMDLEGVLSHFDDDVVIVSPGGVVTGRDVIRRNYEWLFNGWPSARHLWGEVTVRFVSPDEAYRGALIYESHAKTLDFATAIDIHHLKKRGGRWKIVKRRITQEGSFKLIPDETDAEAGRREFLAKAKKAKAEATKLKAPKAKAKRQVRKPRGMGGRAR